MHKEQTAICQTQQRAAMPKALPNRVRVSSKSNRAIAAAAFDANRASDGTTSSSLAFLDQRACLTNADRAICSAIGAAAALVWACISLYCHWKQIAPIAQLDVLIDPIVGFVLAFSAALTARAVRLEQLEQQKLVQPDTVADADSNFGKLQGVRVHYKAISGNMLLESTESTSDASDAEHLGQMQPERPAVSQSETSTTTTASVNENDTDLPAASASHASSSSGDATDASASSTIAGTIGGIEYTSVGFIHGFGANVFSWEYGDTLGKLARQLRALVVAHDSPGFGLTQRVKQAGKYSIASNAAITRELIDLEARRQSQSVANGGHVLIGHSLGGLVAAQAAVQGAISACVLVAPAIAPLGTNGRSMQRFVSNLPLPFRLVFASLACLSDLTFALLFICAKPALLTALRRAVRNPSFWWRGLRNAWGNADAVTQQLVDGYRKPQLVQGWDVGLVRFIRARFVPDGVRKQMLRRFSRALRSKSKQQQQALTGGWVSPTPISTTQSEMLEKLQSVPTLIIHGTKDRLVPVRNSRTIAQSLGCSLVEMEGIGHTPHEEAPDDFVTCVSEWLQLGDVHYAITTPQEQSTAPTSSAESTKNPSSHSGNEDAIPSAERHAQLDKLSDASTAPKTANNHD